MTYYLVDTENVAQRWIRTVADAAPGDTFLLFYSHNVGTVNMSAFGPGCLRGIRFEFIGCAVGSNAMDFQICTELGRLTALHQGDSFCILSGDGGFDAVVRYWRDRNVDVRREAPAIPEEHDPERSVQDVYKTMLRDAGIAGGRPCRGGGYSGCGHAASPERAQIEHAQSVHGAVRCRGRPGPV